MLRVLFLRTGNSCRSQRAEGSACHSKRDGIAPRLGERLKGPTNKHYRRVRDEVADNIVKLSEALKRVNYGG